LIPFYKYSKTHIYLKEILFFTDQFKNKEMKGNQIYSCKELIKYSKRKNYVNEDSLSRMLMEIKTHCPNIVKYSAKNKRNWKYVSLLLESKKIKKCVPL